MSVPAQRSFPPRNSISMPHLRVHSRSRSVEFLHSSCMAGLRPGKMAGRAAPKLKELPSSAVACYGGWKDGKLFHSLGIHLSQEHRYIALECRDTLNNARGELIFGFQRVVRCKRSLHDGINADCGLNERVLFITSVHK